MENLRKLNSWIGLSPFILSLFLALIILIFFKFLPVNLPLFYSLPWGDSQLATREQYLLIPATLALINLINIVISHQLHPSQSFFKKILLLNPLIIGLILIISFVKVVLIFI